MFDKKTEILNILKKVHLIGIGGIGMNGIAEYLIKQNIAVSGSDLTETDITARLINLGAKIKYGHKSEYIDNETDLVVYTSAVDESNPELTLARKIGIPCVKRAEMLGEIVNDKFLIAVSGTHGKTSTTAMIAKVLIECGIDPVVFIGGTADFLEGGTSRIGNSNICVVEADEYDRSFLQLKPDVIIITNIEKDHTDIYENEESIIMAFNDFVKLGKPNLKIIGCGDDKNTDSLLKGLKNTGIYKYGFNEMNKYTSEITNNPEGQASYKIESNEIILKVPGRHNILNSLAALLACRFAGIDTASFAKAIKTYSGIDRRLEVKYRNAITVYDDYAHHPTEINATLQAIRGITSGRVITIFQPHTYTRTRDFYSEFAKSLIASDVVYLAEIYSAREEPITGVSSKLIYSEILKNKKANAFYFSDNDEIITEVLNNVKPGDVLIFQGAGNINLLCKKFIEEFKKRIN